MIHLPQALILIPWYQVRDADVANTREKKDIVVCIAAEHWITIELSFRRLPLQQNP